MKRDDLRQSALELMGRDGLSLAEVGRRLGVSRNIISGLDYRARHNIMPARIRKPRKSPRRPSFGEALREQAISA